MSICGEKRGTTGSWVGGDIICMGSVGIYKTQDRRRSEGDDIVKQEGRKKRNPRNTYPKTHIYIQI